MDARDNLKQIRSLMPFHPLLPEQTHPESFCGLGSEIPDVMAAGNGHVLRCRPSIPGGEGRFLIFLFKKQGQHSQECEKD
jgi:hypothetical protein